MTVGRTDGIFSPDESATQHAPGDIPEIDRPAYPNDEMAVGRTDGIFSPDESATRHAPGEIPEIDWPAE